MHTRTSQQPYWSFYWPLTVMGLAMLLSVQFQNGILSRYPNAATELTVFALAGSFYWMLRAALIFLPQMMNVFCRSDPAIGVCFRFTARIGVALSAPLLLLGWTPIGPFMSAWIFGVNSDTASVMQLYFRFFAPLVFVESMRHSLTGLLIQSRRTGWVTVVNVSLVIIMISLLLTGFLMGLPAVVTVGIAHVGSGIFALAASYAVWKRHYRLPDDRTPPPTSADLWMFFWPVAVTSICFALSRPVIFVFASRTDDAIALIAALRVAFDFSLLFFNPINQFRDVLVTFGMRDPGVRRFIIRVAGSLSIALLIVAVSPLKKYVIGDIFGLEGVVLDYAGAALLPLSLVPVAMGLRNWLHGHALIAKTTRRMGAAAITRVGMIMLAAWILIECGLLGPRTAALLLAVGFFAEAATMWLLSRWLSR